MLRRLNAAVFDDDSPQADRFGLLLAAAIAVTVVLSLVDLSGGSDLATRLGSAAVTIFVGGTFVLTTRAAGVALRWRRYGDVFVAIAVVAAIALIVAEVLDDEEGGGGVGAPSPIWSAIAVMMPILVVRRILTHRRVTIETILGAISAYLLIATTFTYVFLTIDAYQGEPFFGADEPTTSFMYFSLTSLTTVGYGDLAPATALGGLSATTEAVVGQLFLVTLLAALVGIYAQRGRSPS